MLPLAQTDFTPLSPQAQVAAVSVLGVVLTIFSIWALIRRKPPLESELVKLKGAIEGLQFAVDKLSKSADDHAAHATEIRELKTKVGGLETRREGDLHAQRTYTRETTREIFEKLDKLTAAFAAKIDTVSENFAEKVDKVTSSFGANVQQLEGAMGRLEGTAEQLSKRLDNLER